MIEKDINKFLSDLTATEEFKDNKLARVLEIYWGTKKIDTTKDKIIENLIPKMKASLPTKTTGPPKSQTSETNVEETTESNKHIKDLRVSSIRLASVRGIGHEVEDIPFGIDFCTGKNSPQCAVIVGGNGSGKTSVFSAMEYFYTGEISEAMMRSYGKKEDSGFEQYLHHSGSTEQPFIELTTTNGKTYSQENSLIESGDLSSEANPSSSFVSEFDVYTLGLEDVSSGEDREFHNRVANNLGYRQLIDLLDYLSEVKKKGNGRRIETRNLKKNRADQESRRNSIKSLDNDIKNLYEQLKGETPFDPNKRLRELTGKINSRISEELDDLPLNDLKTKTAKYINYYSVYLRQKSSKINEDKIKFLQLGRNLIMEHRDCPFCEQSTIEPDEIKKIVDRRLEKGKEIVKINNNLSTSFEDCIDTISDFLLILTKYYSIFKEDQTQLSGISEFEELIRNEQAAIKGLDFGNLDSMKREINNLQQQSAYDDQARDELHNFIIDQLSQYLRDEERIEQLNSTQSLRKEQLPDALIKLQAQFDTDGRDTITIIRQEIEEKEGQIKKLNEELQSLKEKEQTLIPDADALERIKKEAPPLLSEVDKKINLIIKNTIDPFKDVLVKAMDVFLENEGLTVKINLPSIPENDSEEISKPLTIELVDKEEKKGNHRTPINPKEYFNAFRYKVFCGTIAMGIALASRNESDINIPLVMDDEFFALISSTVRNLQNILKQ